MTTSNTKYFTNIQVYYYNYKNNCQLHIPNQSWRETFPKVPVKRAGRIFWDISSKPRLRISGKGSNTTSSILIPDGRLLLWGGGKIVNSVLFPTGGGDVSWIEFENL